MPGKFQRFCLQVKPLTKRASVQERTVIRDMSHHLNRRAAHQFLRWNGDSRGGSFHESKCSGEHNCENGTAIRHTPVRPEYRHNRKHRGERRSNAPTQRRTRNKAGQANSARKGQSS